MRRLAFTSLALCLGLVACADETQLPEPLGPLDEVPTFVVRSSDFQSSAFAMLDANGEVIYESWITSGLVSAALTTAIHSDNAMPTVEALDGTFTIIDRYGADRITRFHFPDGALLGQMRTQGETGDVGFASNPQDVVFVSETRALVSRYGQHPDADADVLNRGTDLLEFDPSTMTLTGESIDLRQFNTEVAFVGDDGPVMLPVLARPARMVKVEGGYVVVGLERLTEGFEAAADGAAAIVDLSTDEVTGYDLAPLENCGVVLPVPGAPRRVGIRCLGIGPEPAATAGFVVLEVGAGGVVTELARVTAADHDGANVVGNALFLSERFVVGVELGDYDATDFPDVVHLVDLETGTATPVLTTTHGTDVLGTMAFYPESGVVLIPSRHEGLHRLDFDGSSLTLRDTIQLHPAVLPVADAACIR